MGKKILAIVGIVAGILVIVAVIGLAVYWDTIKGAKQIHKLQKEARVPESAVFKPLTPDQVKRYRPTQEEDRTYVEETRLWQKKLLNDQPVEVEYNTKKLNRIIVKDMINEDIKRDSFYMEVQDGLLVGQASIRNPLDKEGNTWLNVHFKIRAKIRNFKIETDFIELVALKEDEEHPLGEEGLKLLRNFIRDRLQKDLEGTEETGGKASDLYFVKEMTLEGGNMKVVYDPDRFREWRLARIKLRKEGKSPAAGGVKNTTAPPPPAPEIPTEKPGDDAF